MTFDHHAMVQPAVPLPGGLGQSNMSKPYPTEAAKRHYAGGSCRGGFKPALVRHALRSRPQQPLQSLAGVEHARLYGRLANPHNFCGLLDRAFMIVNEVEHFAMLIG